MWTLLLFISLAPGTTGGGGAALQTIVEPGFSDSSTCGAALATAKATSQGGFQVRGVCISIS